ncbi:hypothetical protein MKW92_027756 [Papaver armeniacum]|nr:hypothetical protein MKW92_027756 [Papaver armeniacum]
MTGTIPSCISKLNISNILDLSNNKFNGPLVVPQSLIGSFDMSHNHLSGIISVDNWKRLSRLSSIVLVGNQLSGSIPFSICSNGSQSNPTFIDLSENKLSGTIPTSIGYCEDLNFLNLGSNNLSGNVPNELEQASGLEFLLLHGNNLNGNPLGFISKLQYLIVLNLANNHFRGNIPTAFGSNSRFSIISLRSNMFNGPIPQGILSLNQLQILDLSQNNFSGHIPKILGMCWRGFVSNASNFYGDYNIQLQMVINGIMIRFEKIYNYSSGIDLSHNMLDGSIPTEIGLLNKLVMLNLSHNHLSNNIPAGVGNMSCLGTLDLSFNKLSGHIPQSLTSLDFLGFLNLSYNEFSGRIPRGDHFDTLSVDGSAFLGNNLLCGVPLKKICYNDRITNSSDTNHSIKAEQDDAEERILFLGVVALGFVIGFWGLFFILLLKKDKWWFPYWRLVDSAATKIVHKLHLE